MARLVLKNVLLDGTLTDVTAENGKIVSIGKTEEAGKDCGGAIIVSGLFDIHSHGAVSHDTMDGNFSPITKYFYKNGITSWLATTMTMPLENIEAVVDHIPENAEDEAKIVGFHMEGPYLAEKYKGAQKGEWMKLPDADFVNAHPHILMVTLAPELEGALEEISRMNAVVALGHSAADYKISDLAFKYGAKCLTHTFNAMSPLHHRDPALIGAAYDNGGYVQVITDGFHLHPSVVRMLYRLFGAERMIIISDCMEATGMPDGHYTLGGQPVVVKNGEARLENGTVAGSTTNLMTCVQRAISFGIPPRDAFRMASATPAKLMGLKKGEIAVGYDAEFLLLDQNYQLQEVIVNR